MSQNPHMPHSTYRLLLTSIFLSNLGLTIVYPLFTPLILSSQSYLVPDQAALAERLMLLVFLIASFPLAQFLSSPLFKRLGRVKGATFTLRLSTLGMGVGAILSALALTHMHYLLLLLGRALTGFFAGNMALCLLALAERDKRTLDCPQSFKAVSKIMGISFVLAILIGGVFSNEQLSSLFTPSLPFWVFAIFLVLLLILIQFIPLQDAILNNQTKRRGEFCLLFRRQKKSFRYARFFSLIFFLITLGWIVSLQFLSFLLISHFGATQLLITLTFSAISLLWCFGIIILNPLALRRFRADTLLLISLIFTSLSLLFVAMTHQLLFCIHILCVGALMASLAWTNCFSLILHQTAPHDNRKRLELNPKIATISMVSAPFFGALVGKYDIQWIYLFASTLLAVALLLFSWQKIKNCS